jgi:integrase
MTRALKALGIRHRPAYNARHTWATIALMNGRKLGWVAKQLGHSSPLMTMKHYAKWIVDGDREESGKMDAALGAILGA